MTARREPDLLDVAAALERILTAVRVMPAEDVPVGSAGGRVLAEDVVSRVAHPPWDNSGMDGFAVRAEDVQGAREAEPARLRLVEDVPAGARPSRRLEAGEAIRVMTGAPVPDGADGVIRVEHTDAWELPPGAPAPEWVRIRRDSDAHRNIRRRGEDLEPGQTVLEAGAWLGPAEIGALAMIGRGTVAVTRRPRVAILSTGDEVAGPEELDEVLAGRRIADSNSPAPAAGVAATGAEPVLLGIARDDRAQLVAALERARPADVLVTTAGASVGEHDIVKDALDDAGFELDFWRVRMRPGSPFSFGRLGAQPVFGLPGNPVSALVTFEVLVRPALRRMLGRAELHPPTVHVQCGERIPSKRGLTHFLRVRLAPSDGRGRPPLATLTGAQGSGILTSMVLADALLVVPEDSEGYERGAIASAIPLRPPDAAARGLGFSVRTR